MKLFQPKTESYWSLPVVRKPIVSIKRSVIFALLAISIISISGGLKTSAAAYYMTQADINASFRNRNEIDTSTEEIVKLQAGNLGQWHNSGQTLEPPVTVGEHSAAIFGPAGQFYFLNSFNTQSHLLSYDTDTKKWTFLTSPPVAFGAGLAAAYLGTNQSLYVIIGSSSYFYRYDIAADSWIKLADLPGLAAVGASLAINSATGNIYIGRGGTSAQFFRYSVSSNGWATLAPFPGSSVIWGFDLAFDGTAGLYAVSHQWSAEMYYYTISAANWSTAKSQIAPGIASRNKIFWTGSSLIGITINGYGGDYSIIRSYNPLSNSWTDLQSGQVGQIYDWPVTAAYDGSDTIYALFGGDVRSVFYRYSIGINSWNNTDSLFFPSPYSIYTKELIFDGDHTVYYVGGPWEYQLSYLYKKDLSSGTVSFVTATPTTGSPTGHGFAGTYYNGMLYLSSWIGSKSFYSYEISSGQWTQLTDFPAAVNHGAKIIEAEVSGQHYLYYLPGNATGSMYRYSISGNSWETMSSAPTTIYAGSGVAKIGNIIYVSPGSNQSMVMKYDVSDGQWKEFTSTTWEKSTSPGSKYAVAPQGYSAAGSVMVGDGSRYLYLLINDLSQSIGQNLFYRFDTQTDTWTRKADFPHRTNYYSCAFYDTVTNRVYLQPTATAVLSYWTDSSTDYVVSGTWYSKVFDLTQVTSWGAFSATTGGSGSIDFSARSSISGRVWTNWTTVTPGSTIQNLTVGRYIQFKAVLSGDGSVTPTFSNLGFDYTQETSSPSISTFSAKSQDGGIALPLSGEPGYGNPLPYQHPYFEWTASDGVNGSGVAGYYVYFGTNSSADPATLGSYQTAANYSVSTPLDASQTYYFRIRAKDNLGNLSAAASHYSYRYSYISPAGSISRTSQADFNIEGTTNLNTDTSSTPGQIQLVRNSTGAWSTGPFTALPDSSFGGAMAVVGDYLYVIRGSGTTDFWRYTISSRQWETSSITALPVAAGLTARDYSYPTKNSGSALIWDGGNYLYAMFGNNTTDFYRYSITGNSWLELTDLPAYSRLGASLVSIGNNKLLFLPASTYDFYEYTYSTGGGSWAAISQSPSLSSSTYGGAGLWYDGSDSVYAYFGTAGWWYDARQTFSKYSISANSWSNLAPCPAMFASVNQNLVSDGQGNLYVFGPKWFLKDRSGIMKYTIATNSWTEVAGSDNEGQYGAAAGDGQRYIFMMSGAFDNNYSYRLISYDSWDGRFISTGRSPGANQYYPFSYYYGTTWFSQSASSIAYDGSDKVYMSGRGESYYSQVIEYSLSSGTARYLKEPPFIGNYSSLVYGGGYLYLRPGKSSLHFYRYDIKTDLWQRRANLPAGVEQGGASTLMADSAGNLYTVQGTTGSGFYKYIPASDSWTTLAPSTGYTFQYGAMAYDSANNNFYGLVANGSASLLRYSVAGNSWTALSNLPATAGAGASLIFHDGKLYATVGSGSKSSYIYDIAGNSWTAGTDAPLPIRGGGAMIKINSQYAIGMAGGGEPNLISFIFPSSSTAHDGLASYVSEAFEIEGLYGYAGITAEVDVPAETKIELWTQTSADGAVWDDWAITTDVKNYYDGGGNIQTITASVVSTPRLYTKVKAIFYSYDNIKTPVLDEYTLSYYSDTYDPTNPTILNAYSDDSLETVLVSDTWYNYAAPHFTWPSAGQAGAAYDGAAAGQVGSGIRGEHVYFGTDSQAVPYTAVSGLVTNNRYTASLTTAGTYYLRMQTEDMTGNYDHNVFPDDPPFIYKFDNVPPDNPPIVSVTPSGYSATNSFSFAWTEAYDANSGVAEYCYRTGAASGTYAVELCAPKAELLDNDGLYRISDLPAAYRQGSNILYIRAKDAAGNYSSSAFEAVFYYSTDPPSAVTNLEAIPPLSTQNSFTFRWDLPATYAGDTAALSYCYSVNALPSSSNTTCTSERYLPAFKAATQTGSNALYVAAKDQAGSVNWNNYAVVYFTANTTAPGIPLNLTASDTSDSNTGRWSITLTWDKPQFEGNGVDHYVVERSADSRTFTAIGEVSNSAYVDMNVSQNVDYYYRVKAADALDNLGGASATVGKSAEGKYAVPPPLLGEPAATVSFNQAIVTWETPDRASTSKVYYGKDPNRLDLVAEWPVSSKYHSVTVTSLQSQTTYYYKVMSLDANRDYEESAALSNLYSFRTTESAQITDVKVEDITLASAYVKWRTSIATISKITYGLDTQYGLTAEEGTDYSTNHIYKLDSLTNGTTYHFRIISTAAGSGEIKSDDYQFSTVAYPVISNIKFQPVVDAASVTVKVTWQTNVPTDSGMSYKTENFSRDLAATDLVTDHEMTISDLAGNTEYAFNLKGRDRYGNLATSDVQTWRSDVDTRAPQISNISVDVSTTGAVGNAKALVIISWDTDEPATSQVRFGQGSKAELNQETALDTNLTTTHTVVIPNLELSQIYRMQPAAKDASGNNAFGEETVAITPRRESSLLDILIGILNNLFGHFGK